MKRRIERQPVANGTNGRIGGCPGKSISHTHKNLDPSLHYYYGASPTSGESPLEVMFLGSGNDPDGNIVSYQWNFGDGSSSTSQNPTHTYQRVSSDTQYTVTLTVTDNDGATGQATTTITVNPDSTPPSPPSGITVN